MTELETAEAINHRATEWVARIDRAPLDADGQAELEAWIAADVRRQGALLRAQAAWDMMDRARALGSVGLQHDQPEQNPTTSVHRRRFLQWGGALAASITGGIGLSQWFASARRVETTLGELRRVPLADGSLAAINTASKVTIQIRSDLRYVQIEEGEAWFQVAKDSLRPFVVKAGAVNVRALGTAFSVRRLSGGSDVQVTEGSVEVWSDASAGHIEIVSSGARSFVNELSGPTPPVEASSEIQRTLSWRDGELVFEGNTLADAATQFNRYNRQKLVIEGTELAAGRIVGRFSTNEPLVFAQAAAITLDAHIDVGSDEIHLSRKLISSRATE